MRSRLTILAALTLILSACSGGGATTTSSLPGTTTTMDPGPTIPTTPPTTGVVTIPPSEGPIVVWVDDEALAGAVEDRAAAFAAARGVAVEVRVYQPPADGSGLLDAVLLGTLDGPADIVLGAHTRSLELATAGRAEPVALDGALTASITAAVSPRGYPLAVPLAVDGVVQVRRTATIATAPAAVEDIDCPAQPCLLLPADGDAEVHYPFLVALGGYLFGRDASGALDPADLGIDSEESVAGVTILQDLITAGVVGTRDDGSAVAGAVAAGEAPLAWVHARHLATATASGGVVVEPLPAMGGAAAVTAFRVLAAYVNPFGATKSEAVEFATRWLGDPGGSAVIALATGMAPVWPEAAGDSMSAVLQSVEAGHAVPPVPGIDRMWFEVSDAFRRIYLGTTPEAALIGAAGDIIE